MKDFRFNSQTLKVIKIPQGTRKKRFGLTTDHLLFYHFFFFFLFGFHKLPPTPNCLPIVHHKSSQGARSVFLVFESLFFVPERSISSNPIGRQLLCVFLSAFLYSSCFCSSDLFTANSQQQFPLNVGG